MGERAADCMRATAAMAIAIAVRSIKPRKAAGLTQSQLARLARVRVETISRLENGLHMPSARTFDKIERAIKRSTRRPAA